MNGPESHPQLGRKSVPTWLLYLLILIQQFLASLAFPLAKLGLLELDPFVFAFLRFSIASIIYIPILLILRKGRRIPIRDNIRIFIIGIVLIPFNQVIFLIGQARTSAGHASLLFATIPIFIYILAILFLGEKPTWRRTLGILIAAGGVYLILAGGASRFGGEFLAGDLLILVAVLAWAIGTIMAKPLLKKYGAFRVTGLALVYGSLLYIPYGFYRIYDVGLIGHSYKAWISVLYLAIGVSILAYFLWYWVLKYLEASRMGVIQNIQPVIATAVAAMILSETISSNFIIGGLIVIFGVVLTEIK